MNSDEARDLLADYLGDELDDTRKRRFEAHLTDDPELAAEVDAMRRTMSALRSLDMPMTPTVAPTASRSPISTLLRYAAIVVFAFGAGYLTHNVTTGPVNDSAPTIVRPGSKTPPDDWETRVAMAYAKAHGHSSLARSLVALAHAAE